MPLIERYYNGALATGTNDGTSEANAWQSMTDIATDAPSEISAMAANTTYKIWMKRNATDAADTGVYPFTLGSIDPDQAVIMEGYNTTPGDGWLSIDNWWQMAGSLSMANTGNFTFRHIDIQQETSITSTALYINANAGGGLIHRCRGKNIYAFGRSGISIGNGAIVESIGISEATSGGAGGISLDRGHAIRCVAYGGINLSTAFRACFLERNLVLPNSNDYSIDGNGLIVINDVASHNGLAIVGNTVWGGGDSGLVIDGSADSAIDNVVLVSDNIFYNLGGYAIENQDATDTNQNLAMSNNFYGACTSGFSLGINTDGPEAATSLSSDPFTDAAGGDFSINSVSGGGALIRALRGMPTVDLNLMAGAWQRPESSGGASYPTIY